MVRLAVHLNPRVRDLSDLLSVPKDAAEAARDEAGRVFRTAEIALFASEGGTRAWAPLSPRYAAWKWKHYPGRKILVRTGAMRRAFVNRTDESHVEEVFRVDRVWRIRLGAVSRIAQYHAEGTRTMPARPPIQLSGPDWERLHDAVARGLLPYALRALKILQAWSPPGPGA